MALKQPRSWTCLSSSCWNLLGQQCQLIDREDHEVRYLLLAFGVEIYPAHLALPLVEANVVKPFETGAVEGGHAVVGHEEVLLPAHEDVLALREVWYRYRDTLSYLFAVWPKC